MGKAEIAAELRAREEEQARRSAELEGRRKDALERAAAQQRYEEEIEAELRRREEEELRRQPSSSRLQNAQDGLQASRGRLQVIQSARPALQRFEEDEEEFARFQPQRQRNRG